METPDIQQLNKNTIRETYIEIHYPEFHKYITDNYPTDLKWTEKLYWYYHGLTARPTCPVCRKSVNYVNFIMGYWECCSNKCMCNYDVTKEKRKQTSLKHYGVEIPSKCQIIKDKMKRTLLDVYGVDHPSKSPEIQERKRQTTLNHYGVENPFASPEIKEKIKQTCLDKYGEENPAQSQMVKDKIISKSAEIQQKSYETKKKNHSFKSSKFEQEFKKWLDDNNIDYRYQYKSDKYPFNCDFYFPDKDLYLEIQGHWTHGKQPFDPNNQDDITYLNFMKSKNTKFYDNAIDVWTIRDPLKRSWAKDHKLNWVEVFSTNLDDILDACGLR